MSVQGRTKATIAALLASAEKVARGADEVKVRLRAAVSVARAVHLGPEINLKPDIYHARTEPPSVSGQPGS
ncbi:hypothetical protein [Micromonospora sp. LOL_024]|uniref:hypothetical protein n=1 Tax=Micromonospora sp. LOL_024 TaxID=3345412 RepID=UPI003A88177B